ncbi:hypothetical protein BCR44DRAFT_1431395 [Catenaria anguillulae PL171]|uniref:Uncharacterized protein n=1 Tax=Catenaria anguillulae PL171 TaxID=765915 RepID=A0A1Y2HTQ1_9FUNG|nr:hypothetical protein BCR44DRAFT_1431395 [Catenaria anguillulae PL171]
MSWSGSLARFAIITLLNCYSMCLLSLASCSALRLASLSASHFHILNIVPVFFSQMAFARVTKLAVSAFCSHSCHSQPSTPNAAGENKSYALRPAPRCWVVTRIACRLSTPTCSRMRAASSISRYTSSFSWFAVAASTAWAC